MNEMMTKALEVAGPVEWEEANERWRLMPAVPLNPNQPRHWCIVLVGEIHADERRRFVFGYEALALIRDHLRQWLEKRAVCIITSFTGKSGCVAHYEVRRELRNEDGYLEGDGGVAYLCRVGDGKFVPESEISTDTDGDPIYVWMFGEFWGTTYLDALAAAVLAIGGEA